MSIRDTPDMFRHRPPKRRHPERDAQKAILTYLKLKGCLVAITDSGAMHRAGRYGGDTVPEGWPDLTCCMPDGRFLGVEVKAPKGTQSLMQKICQQQIETRGGVYILAYSIDDLRKVIP